MSRDGVLKLFGVAAFLLALPVGAYAQASIAGVVRDTSGAVLPGVTIEAASPELIEKVRSSVSDGNGQYRITELRPGAYTVTFRLSGFATVVREGIELTGSNTATISVNLRVGALEETITVTGESPLVDVQGVSQQRTLSRDVLDAIPTGRSLQNMVALIPGITMGITGPIPQDVGGSTFGSGLQSVAIHGGRTGDQRVMMDGVSMMPQQSGNVGGFTPNMGSTQEVTVETSGGGAEDYSGGVKMNLVPKQGGNRFSGSFFATGANSDFQSSNYSDKLRNAGFPAPNPAKTLKMTRDVTPSLGGPIVRDRLWFFVAGNWHRTQNLIAVRPNLNAGNPSSWLYSPDVNSTQAQYTDAAVRSSTYRVTYQINNIHKVSGYMDVQKRCICPEQGPTTSPEATFDSKYDPSRFTQYTWSAPMTSRLLLDASFVARWERWGDYPRENISQDLIGVTDNALGITYRGNSTFSDTRNFNTSFKSTASLVTGAHAFKTGITSVFAKHVPTTSANNFNRSYSFLNGVPNSITLYATPTQSDNRMRDLGLFVQDRWTINRLTLNGGLRFDYVHTYFPAQSIGPAPNVPNRNLSAPATDWVSWKDISPRMGASYDLFGNGRTAVKVSYNRYLAAQSTAGNFGAAGNPINRLSANTTRSWNDNFFPVGDPRRGNFVPDCDLLAPGINAECGAMGNALFGQTFSVFNADPDLLEGWGKRAYNWEFSATVQQQILSRVSAEIGYFRRTYGNFTLNDNLLVEASDFDTYSLAAPLDSRLPGGGGYTLSGLYNVKPNKFGQTNNLLTMADKFGEQIERWHGMDFNLNVRAVGGLVLQGGFSTGNTLTDACEIRRALPETGNLLFCKNETGFRTQTKGLVSYTIPRIDVQASSAFQIVPGGSIAANRTYTNAEVQPSLGRPLSGGSNSVSVNLIEPNTVFRDNISQVDVRLGKILRLSGTKTTVNFDIFNAFNGDTIIGLNQTFGPIWQQPQSVLPGRLMKVSAQFDF